MIDIHTHILPGIDDGAQTLEEAVDMLKRSSDSGTDKLILTPHFYNPRIGYVDKNDVYDVFTSLKEAASHINIELFLGSENFCSDLFLDEIDKKQFYTINDTEYLLIEFPFNGNMNDMYDAVDKIISCGYRPIIAHPERYPFFRHSEMGIDRLLNKGCLFQINKTSLLNLHGRSAGEFALWMLDNQLASFVATDTHDTVYRTSDLDETFMWLYRSFSKAYAEDLLFNNPERLLSGKDIFVG